MYSAPRVPYTGRGMMSSNPIDEYPMGIPARHWPETFMVRAVTPSHNTMPDGTGSLSHA